jgi:pimeloyl-ACP methyl ester carboxylesterase
MPNASVPDIIGPASSYYVSQRLKLHYVDWGNADKPLLLLVHGGRDHARSWDWVARALREDYHVVCPDLRGHGDSAWAIGGHYTLPEFVLDLAQLIELFDEFPVTIIGHSLGGAVSLHYTGIFPERVAKLVCIEGLGPPPGLMEELRDQPLWQRTRSWTEQVRAFSSRTPRRYPSIAAAAQRMIEENAFLSEEQAQHLTVHGVSRNEDGTYSWKFDNYSRIFYPQRLDPEEMKEHWSRILCPTFVVGGSESWFGDPREDGRLAAIPDARAAVIEGAGHWVHHDRLELFLELVREFLGSSGAGGAAKARGDGAAQGK